MRKILFLLLLLLLTVASYGQTTTGKETKFPYGIRNQSVQTITTPTYLNTQGTDGTQGVIPSAYIEKTANKTNTISGYSETLYPNEKATHDALDLKLNISDLPTNLTLYPTTTTSDVSGYVVMVKDIHDVRYNTTAVDVSTPTITTTDQLVSQRISDAGILIGQPGVFNITTFGNIRHLSGSGTATFYFKVFHRDSLGVETLICTSSISSPVTDGGYSEFTASGVWDDGDFIASDRIVIKSYANRIAGGSDPVYQFQFGGTSPVRTLLPVPFSVVDAGYELKSNKSSSLTPSDDLYPNNNAVLNALPVNYSKIVYVNATSPITATIFDTENPPVTNDNLLKNDVANLYIGTDASTWVYNSSTYVTKTVPSTSNFNNFGTTVDAGSSKTSHITRSGAVTLTGPLNILNLKVSSTPVTSAGSYDILTRNSSTTALEKKLLSDFVQIIGNQNIAGIKTFETIITNNSDPSNSGSNFRNYNTGNGTNVLNTSTGIGSFIQNQNNGVGIKIKESGAGVGLLIESDISSTTNIPFKITDYTGAMLAQINRLGNLSAKNITSLGSLGLSNTSNTFTSFFTNVNTASRTYTLPDVSGNLAVISQTTTNGVTDKSPSEDAVFDAIDGVVKTIISYTPTSTLTGTLSETLIQTHMIPAEKLPTSCAPNIKVMTTKLGTAGTLGLRIRVNTTNNFGTATLVASVGVSATVLGMVVNRTFVMQGGNLIHTNTANIVSDENTTANATSIVTYNPAVDQYWFFSLINGSSADTSQIRSIKMIN